MAANLITPMAATQGAARLPIGLMLGVAAQVVRAQVPSLPLDDPLTSDEKGVYFSYTRSAIRLLIYYELLIFNR